MNKKLLIQALLFLPIIIGILMLVGLAAYAQENEPEVRCDGGDFRAGDTTDVKTLYGGVYKDLTFFRKLAARASIYEWTSQFNKTAIAFTFPADKVIHTAHANQQEAVLGEFILQGKVAFARRHEDTLKLVPSPEVVWAFPTAIGAPRTAGHEWAEVRPETHEGMAQALSSLFEETGLTVVVHSRTGQPVETWVSRWEDYSQMFDVSTLYAGGELNNPAMAGSNSFQIDDLVALSAEKSILGLCNEGRVITWNGLETLPDIATTE